MCDESTTEYKDGEIVWVKLGSRWWPGEVKGLDNLPAEIGGALKKTPLAVVKFFDEDSYEFVRNWSNIYPYNCNKKNDFIKKGMDAFRAKQSHMEKFPKDVSTAEMKTDGNPNILSDPIFAPEKKMSYSALFFGNSPGAKKPAKEATPRKKPSQSKNQSPRVDPNHITHRRFLGNDDYVAHIRIQYPGRDRNSDDEITEPPQEKKEYTCNMCRFVTDCLEVIILHNAAHMRSPSDTVGSFTTSRKEKKPVSKKDKSKQPKKSRLSASQVIIDSSDEDNEVDQNKGKRKRKAQGSSKTPKQRKITDTKPKAPVDIRSDLLAEWDDGSDNEIEMSQESKTQDDTDLNETQKSVDATMDSSTVDITNMDTTHEGDVQDDSHTLNISDDFSLDLDKTDNDFVTKDTVPPEDILAEKPSEKPNGEKLQDKADTITATDSELPKTETCKPTKKSCFDFDEEEEESVESFIIASSSGRKIPRVIPPTGKRLSIDLESALASSPIAALDSDDSQLKTLQNAYEKTSFESQVAERDFDMDRDVSSEQGSSVDKTNLESDSHPKEDNLESAFSDLLDATAVPDLPEIPNTLKFEQNFHCTKTIKFPDKTESPKPTETKSSPTKLNENLTNVATKLTNPKKRFAKSFEDFEQKRIASEEKRDHPKEQPDVTKSAAAVESEVEPHISVPSEEATSELHFPDSHKDTSCKLMFTSDVFYDANLRDKPDNKDDLDMETISATSTTKDELESSGQACSLKFSKLKTQVMTRLQESRAEKYKESELSYEVSSKVRRSSSSHRTPRSKILETYRNEHLAEQEVTKTSKDVENTKLITSLDPVHPEFSTLESLLSPKPSENVPSSLVEAGASQYCLKKKKYSKLSRALSREQEDFKILPDNVDKNEKNSLPSGAPLVHNTLLCSIPLPEETDLLAEITKAKFDKTPTLKRLSSETVASSELLDDDSKNEKSTASLPDEKLIVPDSEKSILAEFQTNEDKLEICNTTEVQASEGNTETPKDNIVTEAEKIDSKLAEQHAATEMEKLFSEDSQSLFSDEVQSEVSVVVPPPVTKPEFSSTSELMMELADGEKSSSAEDVSFSTENIEYKLTDTTVEDEEGTANKDPIEVTSKDVTYKDEKDVRRENERDITRKNEKDVTSKDETDVTSKDVKDVVSKDETNARSKDETDVTSKDEKDVASKDEADATSKDETDVTSKDEIDVTSKDEIDVTSKDEKDVTNKDEDVSRDGKDTADKVEKDITKKDEKDTANDVEEETSIADEIDYSGKIEKDGSSQDEEDEFQLSQLEESLLLGGLQDDKEDTVQPFKIEKIVRSELIKEPAAEKEAVKEPSTKCILLDAQELVSNTNMLIESESVFTQINKNIDKETASECTNIEMPCTNEEMSCTNEEMSFDSRNDSVLEQSFSFEKPVIEDKHSEPKNESICVDLPVEANERSLLEAEVTENVPQIDRSSENDYVPKTSTFVDDGTEHSLPNDSKSSFPEIDQRVNSLPIDSLDEKIDEQQKKCPLTEANSFFEEPQASSSLPQEESKIECEMQSEKNEPENSEDTINLGNLEDANKSENSENMNTACFKYTPSKDDVEFDIALKTNFTNFSNSDEMSALTTLATVSELKDSFETGLMLQKNEEKLIDQVGSSSGTSQEIKTDQKETSQTVTDFTAAQQLADEKDASNQNVSQLKLDEPVTDSSNESHSVVLRNNYEQDSAQKSITEINIDHLDYQQSSHSRSVETVSPKEFEKEKDSTKHALKLLPPPSVPMGHVEIPSKMQELNESDMVPIDGNLTVVSEKELADCQVEISSSSSKNPVTLTSFSMDYAEQSSNSSTKDSSGTSILKAKLEPKRKRVKPISAASMMHTYSEPAAKASSTPRPVKPHKPKVQVSQPYVEKSTTSLLGNSSVLAAVCDLEEHIPPQIVCAKNPGLKLIKEMPKMTKTGRIEADGAKRSNAYVKETKVPSTQTQTKSEDTEAVCKSKSPKFIVKSKVGPAATHTTLAQVQPGSNKPIILSEKIIKPVADADSVSVQKITSKRTYQDVEDIDTFIIQKSKRPAPSVETTKPSNQNNTKSPKSGGKAKILQQTIITASGEIIQPMINQVDDNVFDINSMPIVLSDDLLTPESIEKMPIVLSESLQGEPVPSEPTQIPPPQPVPVKNIVQQQPQQTVLNKSLAQGTVLQTALTRTLATTKVTKSAHKVIQNTTGRLIKHTSPSGGKTSKYIILPQSSTMQEAKPAVVKKQAVLKKASILGTTAVSQSVVTEPVGSKIMIVTDQHGQKQKLLLTPNHQKLLAQGSRVTKTVVKGNVMQKSIIAPRGGHQTFAMAFSTGAPTRSSTNSLLLTTNASPSTTVGQPATTASQLGTPKNIKIDLKTGKKMPVHVPKTATYVPVNKPSGQKTILLKNQLGQPIRKVQNTDEALLEKQVAEQLQAIKASGMKTQHKPELNYKGSKTTVKRSHSKRTSLIETQKPTVTAVASQSAGTSSMQVSLEQKVPPLTPLASRRTEHHQQVIQELKPEPKTKQQQREPEKNPPEQQQRQLNQVVIQDATGVQTTITEGQILALPSESPDGQPHSYMLVTLDESGNLTPLNSEALMSLDPNLFLGCDMNNMMFQLDPAAFAEATSATQVIQPQAKQTVTHEKAVPEKKIKEKESALVQPPQTAIAKTTLPNTHMKTVEVAHLETQAPSREVQPLGSIVGPEPAGQQLIVTGDPLATQKFLESLSEGTTDLANILANAEGGSILIQADGQQILINTDSDNQNLLLSVNTDNVNISENSESGGNPMFATQPKKNKDILAAALAGTDVFQQEQNSVQNKVVQSQLSPNSSLYPMNVGNVLEPTLTLSSPIMTPLEVPSTNSKKIADDEADILAHVPKNVDLPITITDPNISQTVSQQQVASLIANELQSNLELPLPMTESTISAVTTDMSSPSYVYTLPSFDDAVDMPPKSFNSSMPLLTEDSDEKTSSNITKGDSNASRTKDNTNSEQTDNSSQSTFDIKHDIEIDNNSSSDKISSVMHSDGSLMEEEGLCTLGGEMCTSLSEPPPDMFELDTVNNENVSDIPEKANEMMNNGVSKKSTVEREPEKISGGEEFKSGDTKPLSTNTDMNIVNEDSCEIPILPQIVTSLSAEQPSSEFGKRNMEHEGKDDNT